MNIPEIGSIISGTFWSEPVRIIAAKVIGDFIELTVEGVESKNISKCTLDESQWQSLAITPPESQFTYQADPVKFRLAVEALLIRLAHEFDPHVAVSVCQIDPLPHQLEAVYGYLLPQPRIRFLLADDPGSGKTIMAGLLLKELKLRGLVTRTLIVVPANLTDQWRREMKDRFGEDFRVVRRASVDDFYGRNIWQDSSQCITSIDFAKRENVIQSLQEVRWDLVIVDEAHKMAAYMYGDEKKESIRYKLGKILSQQGEHFMMLTATPHKGDPNNFLLLMQLIDADAFAILDEGVDVARLCSLPYFARRMKEDMVDFDGKPLFKRRNVTTVAYKLSDAEQQLYDAVTEYVEEQSTLAALRGKKGRIVGFALALLQRRLASSVYAIRRSLERRHERLSHLKETIELLEEEQLSIEDLDDLTDEERENYERKLELISNAQSPEELEKECRKLENLIVLAREVEKQQIETKLNRLHDLIKEEGFVEKNTKLIIFTEHKDTLDYLVQRLRSWGLKVTQIHGGMRLGDAQTPNTRIYAEREFRDSAQILVATEAAGEGINLQFCWVMINYDIPWNPNRLEQRMGRIHRYGQTKDVQIFNLVADDTREGHVLKLLIEKIKEIQLAMGSDRVFDVISHIIPGAKLDQLFREALAKQRSWENVESTVDSLISLDKVQQIRDATLEGLALRHIDLSKICKDDETSKEQRLMPEYIERFFLTAFSSLGGTCEQRKDGSYRIERVPYSLINAFPDVQRRFGAVSKEYKRLTFQKDVARREPETELIGPSHPLFEVTLESILREYRPLLTQGAVFVNVDATEPSALIFIEAEVRDGLNTTVGKRLFAVEVHSDGSLYKAHPSLIVDCAPLITTPSSLPPFNIDSDLVKSRTYGDVLTEYVKELETRRKRELNIISEHVERSLNTLIAESQSRLMRYRKRLENGEDMAAAIRQEELYKRDLEERLSSRQKQIKSQEVLTLGRVEIIGIALIVPPQDFNLPSEDAISPQSESNEEKIRIEKKAMEVAMNYETDCGRQPIDVSKEYGRGFDILSLDSDGNISRRIEVKGLGEEGSITLTTNEWFKAQRFGDDYWLYIVTSCNSEPKLERVQNPASQLKPTPIMKVERYAVSTGDWKRAVIG